MSIRDFPKNRIKFKIIIIALFTMQSLQSSFKGNYVSTIDLYITFG